MEHSLRIKLRFENTSILTPRQREDGLHECWFVVRLALRSIADVASDILSFFLLHESCPYGISLSMDNFCLPPSQPTCLLKDGDVISVKKRNRHGSSRVHSCNPVNCLEDLDAVKGNWKFQFGGVKPHAIDEFEKETGGYESEEEEEEDNVGQMIEERENMDVLQRTSFAGKRSLKKQQKLKGNGVDKLDCDVPLKHEARESKDGKGTKKRRKLLKLLNTVSCQNNEDNGVGYDDVSIMKAKGRKLEAKVAAGKMSHTAKVALNRTGKEKTLTMVDGGVQKKRKISKDFEQDEKDVSQPIPVTKGKDLTEKGAQKGGAVHVTFLDDDMTEAIEIHKSKKCKKEQEIEKLKPEDKVAKKEKKCLIEERGKKREKKKVLDKVADNYPLENVDRKVGNTSADEIILHGSMFNVTENLETKKTVDANLQQKEVCSVNQELNKKPSRSAIRKKAKRRWKREHAASLAEAEKEDLAKTLGIFDQEEEMKTSLGLESSQGIPDKLEEDLEAEEEVLPIVVRPGHIRFEPYEESEGDGCAHPSKPVLRWKDGMCKKQGQKWGMEKSFDKWGGNNRKGALALVESEKIECAEPQTIAFDGLPSLANAPQEGDVLAYRLVELTSSMCPELSDYRVGQVTSFETVSGMIILTPLHDYPIKKCVIDSQNETDMIETFLPPYDEDGSLKINISLLVDTRLMSTSNQPNKVQEPQIQQNPKLPDGVDTIILGTVPATVLSNPAMETHKGENIHDSKTAVADVKCGTGHILYSEEPVAVSHTDSLSQEVETNYAQAWQEISTALQKKKVELSQKTEHDECKQQESGLFLECVAKDGRNMVESSVQYKSGSYRFLRAGALGPTMALLRSQDAL